MDPMTLATAAVSILVPFLERVGGHVVERSSQQLGEAALQKVKAVYEAFRARFQHDPYATALLRGVEDDPTSSSRQRALEVVVQDLLARDHAFARQLEQLVRDVQGLGDVHILASDTGAVAGRDVHQHGQYVAGRDLNLGGAPAPPPGNDRGHER